MVAAIKSFNFYRFLLVTVAQILLRGRTSGKLPVALGEAEKSLSAQLVIGILSFIFGKIGPTRFLNSTRFSHIGQNYAYVEYLRERMHSDSMCFAMSYHNYSSY